MTGPGPMLNAVTLCVTTIGTMISFAAILAQFIGSGDETLKALGFTQLACLATAIILGGLVFSNSFKLSNGEQKLFKCFFLKMPGWLMFILLLMVVTALLGDLSVILARATGHQIAGLFHLPSLCIVIYATIYRTVHLNLFIDNC